MSLTGLEQYLDTHPDPRIVRIGVAGTKHGEQFGKFAAVVARGPGYAFGENDVGTGSLKGGFLDRRALVSRGNPRISENLGHDRPV